MSKVNDVKPDVVFKNDGFDQFTNMVVVNRRGVKVNVIISDIGFLLMNKDTLSRMDTGLLSILNDRFSGVSESASSALDKFSDDEKLSVLKSRYCQSPSEIENFSKYINENFESLVSEINSNQPDLEPSPEPSPAPASANGSV